MIDALFQALVKFAGMLLMALTLKKAGKQEAEKQALEASNEALSNRPITDADFLARMRQRACDARQNQRKSRDP